MCIISLVPSPTIKAKARFVAKYCKRSLALIVGLGMRLCHFDYVVVIATTFMAVKGHIHVCGCHTDADVATLLLLLIIMTMKEFQGAIRNIILCRVEFTDTLLIAELKGGGGGGLIARCQSKETKSYM